MKRFPVLHSILILSAALLLQACSSGGGNNGSPWQYQTKSRQAAAAPESLNGTSAQQAPTTMDGSNQQNQYASNDDLPPVKVGIILPLSGKNAELGQSMLNAAQLALFEIGYNAFELVPRDTLGTAEGAQTAARDVIQDGAQIVLGPIFAEEVRAAKSVTRNAGVNMIAFSTDWTLADNSTYLMGFTPFDQVSRVLQYSATQGIKTMGVFAPAGSYGDAVVSAYNSNAHRAGITSIQIARANANGSDIPAQMSRFVQSTTGKINALLIPAGGNMARAISQSASQYNLPQGSVRRIGTGLWEDQALASEPSLQGGWFAGPSPTQRQGFERRYRETFGTAAPRLSTLAYDATALTAVLARNGLQQNAKPSFDAASIQNTNGFAGIDGIFRFREGGLAERGLAILELNNGQIRVIEEAPRSFQSLTQ